MTQLYFFGLLTAGVFTLMPKCIGYRFLSRLLLYARRSLPSIASSQIPGDGGHYFYAASSIPEVGEKRWLTLGD